MAAISRANELKQLLPGLNALFGEEYNTYENEHEQVYTCLLYTSPSPRDKRQSRMPSSA